MKASCPSLHVALQNSYSHPSHLYIGKSTILSQEGTTQGDPLAMAMYGIAILPLISRLHNDSLTQKWYDDDGSVVGNLKDIRALFDKLTQLGPKYGYLVNPPKCQLIIKPGGERQALTEFAGTNVEITQGAPVLGSVIGSSEASKNFLKDAEIKYTKFGQTWSICSHLSPECLCMFEEGGSTEVELPLAYYTLHGWGSGQGRGAAWPSRTEHRRQRNNPRGKRTYLSEWAGLASPSHKIFIKILRNQLNSNSVGVI